MSTPPAVTFVSAAEEIALLRKERDDLKLMVQVLESRVDWFAKAFYGPKTERRPPVQDHGAAKQESFLEAPVVAVATAPAASEAEPVASVDAKAAAKAARNAKKGKGADGKAKVRNGGGRKVVNRSLRTVEEVIDLPAHLRTGPNGEELVLLGYEESEREELIAQELVRKVTRRAKYGLKDTRETVITAPVPPAIIPKGKYGDELLIEIMLRKYAYGLPFHRILQDLRALGSDLSDATLSDHAARFACCFSSITATIREQILARPFVHVDETPLPTLDGRQTLWAWVGGDQAFFHVGGRGTKELRKVLGLPDPAANAKGTTDPALDADPDPGPGATLGWGVRALMADAYAPYDAATKEAGLIRLCCWAHARRNFLPVEETSAGKELLAQIQALYRIENDAGDHARHHRLSAEAMRDHRYQLRQREAKPIIECLLADLRRLQPTSPPRTALRTAIDYLLDRWPTFTAYLDQGDLPFDNNQAERAIRPVVIGRKNWMFIGSEDATSWAAQNFTLFESCRMAKVDTRAYLRHVLARLHAGDRDTAALTPTVLKARFPRRD